MLMEALTRWTCTSPVYDITLTIYPIDPAEDVIKKSMQYPADKYTAESIRAVAQKLAVTAVKDHKADFVEVKISKATVSWQEYFTDDFMDDVKTTQTQLIKRPRFEMFQIRREDAPND